MSQPDSDFLSPVSALSRSSAQPLAAQLAQRFARRIESRLLAPGARLPSVRQCAAQYGVNPSTVVAAYDLLLAQALVVSQRGRGFFVRDRAAAGAGVVMSGAPLQAARMVAPVNAVALIRSMFHPAGSRSQPGMGVLAPDWMHAPFMQAAVRQVSQRGLLAESSSRYGDPLGDAHLRAALAHGLQGLGLPVRAEQIMTTVGATHALDVVSRTLLKPGDFVMVEEPGWAVEFARLNAMGMQILPVPRRAHGPDLEIMERYCQLHAPRLFVSVSVLQNPTGYCLSAPSAHRVLQLAHTYDFYVVEDDTYSHMAPVHVTRMCVLDGLQRSFYVSGFAKVLAPNWRVGYLTGPSAWLERLLDTKLLSTLTTPSLFERALMLHAVAVSNWPWLRVAALCLSPRGCLAGSIRAWIPRCCLSACSTTAY